MCQTVTLLKDSFFNTVESPKTFKKCIDVLKCLILCVRLLFLRGNKISFVYEPIIKGNNTF